MRDGLGRRDDRRCERVDERGGEVCVEASREVGGDRPQEVDHPVLGLLRQRQQHGRVGLVVEERELLEPAVRLPSEPAGVRPEEVVEIAELVGVHRGPPAAEGRDGVAVAQLDDGHRATAAPVCVGSGAPGAPAPALVERERRVDEREVREGLGEVPEEAPGRDVVLLGEEAEVVPQPEKPLEQLPRPRPACPAARAPARARTSRGGTSPHRAGGRRRRRSRRRRGSARRSRHAPALARSPRRCRRPAGRRPGGTRRAASSAGSRRAASSRRTA